MAVVTSQITTLDQLTRGQQGRVVQVTAKGAFRRRLMDMGITRGVPIQMLKKAPLGDPVEYRIRRYHLSLRRAEAAAIVVELS